LTFSGQERGGSSEAFYPEFCQCELINETGVINSRVKSRVQEMVAIGKDIAVGLEKVPREIGS